MTRPTALFITVDTDGYYNGATVSINGVPVAHRPYDGSCAEEVEREAIEALGALLRRETGWPKEAPSDD